MTKKTKSNNSIIKKNDFVRMYLAVQTVANIARANGKTVKSEDDYNNYLEIVKEMKDSEINKLLKSLKSEEKTKKLKKSISEVKHTKNIEVKEISKENSEKPKVIGFKESDIKSSGKMINTTVIKDNTANINGASEIVDITNAEEVSEVKTLKVNPDKIKSLKSSESLDAKESKVTENLIKEEEKKDFNEQINPKEAIESIIEGEKDFFSNKTNDVFEVKVTYSPASSEFNGIQLLEDEMKGGNMQIGFYVNAGEFTGDSIKKVRRKRKTKSEKEVSEQAVQISFV